MCKIISFEKHCYRKQKTKEIKATEHYEYDENIYALLESMASEVSEILDGPGIENLIEREKEDRKKFEERYKDVLLRAPASAEAQIQYFASVMSNFLPSIFHSEYKNRFDAYVDFSEFYLSEFDIAYSQYCNDNQEYEKEYPFRFPPLDANTLETELQNCLQQIITPPPVKSSRDRAKVIMWQACRLFELYHNMIDLFSEKIAEGRNEDNIRHYLSLYNKNE